MFFHIFAGTVIVPETPGPSCVRPKSVVTIAESPCSPSDANSSFGVTSAGKSDKFVGKDKELKNHPEWKQDISDDSIYEADTQCDIGSLGVTEQTTSNSHCSSVSHEGKICASALDQEEDIFEAETQCEEPSFRRTVKLFSPSGQRKQDLIRISGIAGVDDMYEIKTQCVLDDRLSETVQHVAVSNENLVQKSFEQENVKVCNINQSLKVGHVIAKDVGYVSDKHDDEIFDSSVQCSLVKADVTTLMDEKGAVGACSKQTKDCVHAGGSLNSRVDVKNSVQGKVEITDSNVLVKRTASVSRSEIAEVHSSNISVQQDVQLDRSREKISSTVIKISHDESCNEDSFDRSLLEGDDEFFTSPAAQTSECKDTAPKTNETFSEIYQAGSKTKSNFTNSDDTATDLLGVSEQCTTEQSVSEKTLAVTASFEKCTTNKLSSVKATTHSLLCNNKEAAKLCDDSGDETDPDNVFEASAQIILPPVTNKKVISNLSEMSVAICSDNIKPATQSPTDPENSECKNKVTEKQNKVVLSHKKNSRKFIKPQDSLKEDSLSSIPNKSVVVRTEKEKMPTQISTEFEDSDDDIYEAPTQLLPTPTKCRDLTKLPESSREKTTDIPPVMHSCRMEVLRQLNYASGDYDNDDSFFEAATQIVETTNSSSKDLTKPVTSFPAEQKKNAAYDYDDSFFEAATQIIETTNTSNKDLTKPVTSSPLEQTKTAAYDYDDGSISEAATQILETPNRSGKEFTKVSTSSQMEEQISAGHDDSDAVSEAATQIVETQNRTSDGFTNASGISLENDTVSIKSPTDDHKGENVSSSFGNKGPKDLGNKTHVADMHSVSAQKLNYPGNRAIKYKESCTSVQKPITTELKKQDCGAAYAQIIAAVRSLPQDQKTENREQKLNSDLQGYVTADHSKGVDESQKILVGITEIALVSKRMDPENSYIKNENDSKSYSGISQQVPLEHHKTISGEHGRVVDITNAPIYESLNDMSKPIVPSSQILANAVRESEAKESPFEAEELIRSEDEDPMPTVKHTRLSHLPNKRAKDRRRQNIDRRRSSTSAGASRRHLPDEGCADVSVMSKTAARISRKRKRELHREDFVQSDTSDIQASKHRRLTQEDSLQNNSKNMASDIISLYSASGCAGEIQQSETEVVVVTDKENSGKGRKSKAATTTNKERDKTVASIEWPGEVEGGRSSKAVTEPDKGNECKVTGKVRKEHIVNKNEDVENAVTRSSRPSRQRKMTWKVQDSLGSGNSQGSISSVEERPKKRSRGSSSCNSKHLTNENRECSTATNTRSRNVSAAKSPSKKLLKSSEDSGSDTCEDVKKSKQNNFVTSIQSVSQRKSTRRSKVGNAVTSASDISHDQSLQQMTRQNNGKVVSNISQKKKNEETVTEVSPKHSKVNDQVFPDEKCQRNITDKCSLKRRMSGLESCKNVSSESSTRVAGRKRRETVNVGFVQKQSADITLPTEDGRQGSVLKKPLCSLQQCTGRTIRRRTKVMNASLSCLKEETASVSLHTSSRTQQGVTHSVLSTEGDDEHLQAKQAKTEKRVTRLHSSSESNIQSDIVDSMPPSRTSRTRGKVTGHQKSETAGTVKQGTDCGKSEKTSQISKTEETNKKLKTEPLTPRSCMIKLSEGQAVTPKRASRRGTPQSCFQHDFQEVSVSITSVC